MPPENTWPPHGTSAAQRRKTTPCYKDVWRIGRHNKDYEDVRFCADGLTDGL